MVTSSNKGFSLIEVLVSVFVLTVGVVTTLGLHLTALQTSQQSAFQTKAMHLAVELAENMRADLFSFNEQVVMASQDDDCARPIESCDSLASSSEEVGIWLQRVADELPSGQARICRDDTPWDVGRETLSWDCSTSSSANAGILVIKIGWRDKIEKSGDSIDIPKLALMVQPAHR